MIDKKIDIIKSNNNEYFAFRFRENDQKNFTRTLIIDDHNGMFFGCEGYFITLEKSDFLSKYTKMIIEKYGIDNILKKIRQKFIDKTTFIDYADTIKKILSKYNLSEEEKLIVKYIGLLGYNHLMYLEKEKKPIEGHLNFIRDVLEKIAPKEINFIKKFNITDDEIKENIEFDFPYKEDIDFIVDNIIPIWLNFIGVETITFKDSKTIKIKKEDIQNE